MNYVTIVIETDETSESIQIEESIFIEAKRIIEAQGLTIERAIELFFRHTVEHGIPFTKEEFHAYKNEQIQKSRIPKIEDIKRVDVDFLTNHPEETLELCHTENIISIERDGKPDLIMMTMQVYEDWFGVKIEFPNDFRAE